ncbi:MAG: TIGR02147 family protein [Chitinispirillaceae bacterium]|nr:TIGR02147 family protein [Chitinispirillaceae bacterium]
MKSIYTYYDYRRFISDFYQEKKALNPNYSYRYIAGKVGIDHALIVKIIRGQRHISGKMVEVFTAFLGLSNRQREYFRLLVTFGKAKNNDDRKYYFEKLLAFSEISEKQIDSTQYEYYQRWYYTAIREILNIRPFKDNYQWLAETVHPSISVVEAKRAVRLLERLGMITRDDEGYCRLTEQFVTTGENWQSIAVRSFQKEACKLASQAIDLVPRDERDVSTVSVSLNEDGVNRVKEALAGLRREIIEIAASCQSVDRACQVNLQLFPVSKIIGDKPEEHS